MITNCPVCGKGFDILWPHLWAYKIGNQYSCTWKCLQRKRKEEEDMPKGKVRDRMKVALEVVDRIRNTEDPIIYLKEIGYGNPGQAYSDIREMLRKTRPDLFAQLPENLRTWRTLCVQEPRKTVKQVETPEGEFTPATVKIDGPLRIETPEAKNVQVVEVPEKVAHILPDASVEAQIPGKKIEKPGKRGFFMPAYIQGFEIVGVKGQYGVYRASEEYNYFEFQPFGGDMCMNPQEWAEQMKELKKAARVLGVEL